MMNTFIINLSIFIGFVLFTYFVFRSLYSEREGLETQGASSSISSGSGIAGNAASYAASIKAESIKLQDTALISKYRADYENVIINLDDLVDNLMLKTALSIDQSKPEESLAKLVSLNNSKAALNNVMKFIDKN